MGGGRGDKLAVAGLGVERSQAPLASLGGHGCEELRRAGQRVRYSSGFVSWGFGIDRGPARRGPQFSVQFTSTASASARGS